MRKIKFLFLLVIMFCLPMVVLADDSYQLSFDLVKCDPTAEGMTAAKCRTQYNNGSLDTYRVSEGGNVEPGTIVMAVVQLKVGTPQTMTALQTFINYDTVSLEPLMNSNNAFMSVSGNNFPTYYDENEDAYLKGWAVETNLDGETVKIVATDINYFVPITEDVEVAYLFFKVKDDATPGSSFSLSFDMDPASTNGNDENSQTLSITSVNSVYSVYGDESRDASLKTLEITNGSITYPLSPTFTPGSVENLVYSTVVPNDVDSITISGTANDGNASVSSLGLGSKDLQVGDNKFEVVVTAQYGNFETYEIHVYRLSNDATLSDITLTNSISLGSIIDGQYTYTASIPYSTKTTNISASTTHSNAWVESGNGDWTFTNSGVTLNTKSIIVKAENCNETYASVEGNTCTTQTYTLNISREAPSENNYLSSLVVTKEGNILTLNPTFDKDTITYTLSDVSNDTTSLDISATVEDTGKATIISGLGTADLKVGDNTIKVIVQAENGSEKTYSINVRRLSNNVKLKDLTLTSNPQGTLSPTFSSTFDGEYTYTYDPTVNNITITATVEDTDNARISIVDVSDGSTPSTTGVLNTTTETFANTVTKVAIVVTAEDGTVENYIVNLNRLKSSNNYLSSLTVSYDETLVTLNPNPFVSGTRTYTASVPGNVTEVDVTAVPAVSYAKGVTITGNTNLQFGLNTIEIEVEAEDGTKASYIVNLTREKYTNATLSDLTVNGTTITGFVPNDNTALEYTLPKVSFETTSLIINGTKTNEYASVTGFGTVDLNTGDNKIVVSVTSHDEQTTNEYIINVYREKNNDNSVHGITVSGIVPSLNDEGKYEVTLPNSKTELNKGDVVISASDDATVEKGEKISLSTKSVNIYIFKVIAENGDEVEYEILVTREPSDDASISRVNLTIGTDSSRYCLMEGESTTCTIGVPVDTTKFSLEAIIHDEASVSPVNGTEYDMSASESSKPITLTVTAEDGTVATYTVNVERQKSSNNKLSDLQVNGVQVPNFNSEDTIYNVSVPGTVEDVTVSATVEDSGKATIVTDLTKDFTLDFGRNQIDVVVKAENGDTKTYTIFVTRLNRTDATLSDLQVNGTTITGFVPKDDTALEYTLTNVPYSTTALNILPITSDELATVDVKGLVTLKTGNNVIEITVTAHDTSVKNVYKINVYRELNNDTSIKGMSLSGVEATLNTETNNYEVTVPNSVTEANQDNLVVTVNDTLLETDAKATYSFTNTTLDTASENIIPIIVKAEDGTEKTYNLVVTREKSKVATLDSITVTNGSFSPSFNKDIKTYSVTVPVETTEFDVSATKTDSKSKIISGVTHYTMSESDMTVQIVVVSEDESVTETYTLNISRTKSSDNTLSNIKISNGETVYTLDPTFNKGTFAYTVNVPGNIDKVDVDATKSDARAEILSGTGEKELEVGENNVVIRVKSESGAETEYTVKVIRAKKTNNYLSSLTVTSNGSTLTLNPTFNKETIEYTLDDLPYTTTNIKIDAEKEDVDASITGTGYKTLVTGPNSFDIVVTAQDGTEKTYTIKVNRAKNSDATLNLLSIDGYTLSPNFASSTTYYEVTVDSTKETLDINDVTANPTDSNATVVKGATINLSTTSDNFYEIKVTAEDGITEETYTIKVIRPKSSDATLSSIKLTGATLTPTFDKDKTEYTITVPYASTSFEIEGIPTVSKTIVAGNNTYSTTTKTVTLSTVAEDGISTKTYTFNVVEAASNDATLSSLSVDGYPLDKTFATTTLSYSIGNIPNGTTQLKINAIANNVSATIKYYVDGVEQDSNIVSIPVGLGTKSITVKVIAADGVSTKTYGIEYTIIKSSNYYLTKLTPSVGLIDFNKTTYPYELSVDNSITSISFDVETEDSNATITVNGETSFTPKTITVDNLSVGSNLLEILVTAEDGTKKTYTVTIKRLEPTASNDAYLSSLSVEGYSFDKTFAMETFEYSIGSIPFALEKLTVIATPNMGSSKLSYLVNGVKQNSNVVSIPKIEGIGAVTVQVLAEDGTTVKNYKITYSKTASTNAYLNNIIVSEGTLTPTFNKETYSYEVNVGRDVNSIDVTAIKDDNTSIMKINGSVETSPHTLTISPLQSGNTEVTIVLTAENGNVLTYKVVVKKEADILSTITSEEYGHTILNGYIRTAKLGVTGIEMKNQLDNENQYLEIWTADESRIVEDNETLATGMIVKLIIDGEEKDRKYIVIKGDTNGDGEIDLFDAVKILNHYLEKSFLEGAYMEAALVNDDEDIDLFDSVKILNHYLEREFLH